MDINIGQLLTNRARVSGDREAYVDSKSGLRLTFNELKHLRLLFFERKNEINPQDQHSDFNEDVALLKKYVPGDDTVFGREGGNHIRVFSQVKQTSITVIWMPFPTLGVG